MNFLVVDLGSSSCRACLLREDGMPISEARERVPVSYGAGGVTGAAEIDADEALRLVLRASSAALDLAGAVRPDGAGISSMLGWVFLDREGRPLRPAMIWADTRAAREAEALASEIGPEAFYARAARRLSPELLLPKLPWLGAHEPGCFERLASVLSLKDYIVWRLTGVRAMDRATAGYTGLADVARLAWDEHLLARAGLPPGSLPGIASATELAGRAAGEFARAAQLREGTPVALSSSDGTTAMYGTGVLLPGVATLVSGTTDVLMVASRERPDDPGMRLTVNPAMVDGLFLVGGATGLSCGALDYFCSLFGTEIRDREEEIASLPFDENAPFALPGLTGERSPYWNADARGGLVGLGLGHGSAHILRAVMESTCFRLAALLELLGDSGMAPRNIAISGGGSRSGAWNRMRADATGMPVELALRDEATMAGTALFLESALTGAGLIELSAARIGFGEAWEPAARLVEQYRARRTRFESLLAAGQVSTRR